jgi:hypothetical protein
MLVEGLLHEDRQDRRDREGDVPVGKDPAQDDAGP